MACDRGLGGFEHLLLLAILRLEDNAYGATVRRELIECADKDVKRPLYVADFKASQTFGERQELKSYIITT